LFPLVDRIIERAPKVEGWRFIALKPAKGFDFKIDYDGIPIDPRSLRFLPLKTSDTPQFLGLRIGVPHLRPKHQASIENAVFSILNTALGERVVALEIQHVEVCRLPRSPRLERFIPLPELPAYLEWRKGMRRRRA
jgi:hypothetical protein